MAGYELRGYSLFFAEDGADKLIESRVCFPISMYLLCRDSIAILAVGFILQPHVPTRPEVMGHRVGASWRTEVLASARRQDNSCTIY